MRDLRADTAEQGAVGGVEPDAVGQHAARPKQAVARIHVEVAARLREQLGHPTQLVLVLGHVRLQVSARIGREQTAGQGQLRIAAGGGEAHGVGVGAAGAAVPALDELDAVALGAVQRVGEPRGGVAVHQAFAGDDAHAALLGGSEQGVGRGLVHRGEDHRGRRAMGQQRVKETARANGANGRVGIAQLGRKGVSLEPVQQLGAVAGNHLQLRHVHMGVDEARHQQLAAVVVLRPGGVGGFGLHAGDAAVVHQQPVVRPPAQAGRCLAGHAPARVGGEVEQIGAQGQPTHAAAPGSPGRATFAPPRSRWVIRSNIHKT